MVASFVTCVIHRIQFFKQFEVCGFLAMISTSDQQIANLKQPHDDVSGTLINLFSGLVNPICVLVNALL